MPATAYLQKIPGLTPALAGADHIDIKTVTGHRNLREFLAAMFSYQPGWLTFLYMVRSGLVRLLGLRQNGVPRPAHLRPGDISFRPGAKLAFFRVAAGQEDKFILAEVDDTHLKAGLAVAVEPLGKGLNRFYVITIVHYHKWTGPVYFNLIRPFHHIVVKGMADAGAQPG
jgi:hypothetical protein